MLSDEDYSYLVYRLSLKTHGALDFGDYIQVCNNIVFSETRRSYIRRINT